MSLTASIFKRLQSFVAPAPAARPPDSIVTFLQNWQSGALTGNWTQDRVNLANQFHGWNYVAIGAIAEEAACLAPQICRVVDGQEVRGELRKSLTSRGAPAWNCEASIERDVRRRFLSKSMKRKALANLQESDELEPISSDHALVKLLKNPNGPDVAYSFYYRYWMYMRLIGSAYIWIVPNRSGMPCQLWVIPSHWVREFATDANGKPTEKLVGSYEIRPMSGYGYGDFTANFTGGGWMPGMGGVKRVDESEIIKIAYPNPLSLVDGLSPVAACGSWLDVSSAIDNSRVQAFYNGAFPGVILQLDKEVSAPDKSQLDRIYERFAEKVSGVRNSRKPYVLAPGLTLAPSPWQSPVEMDHVQSANQIRDWLLAMHRVGPTIAGITEQTSFAADTAARQGFYHGTLRPQLKFLGEVLTEKLCPRFAKPGEKLVCYWPDPTPDDPETKLKEAQALAALSANTPNEIRENFGKKPFEFGGDDPMGSMGQQPLPWATGEQSMGMGGMDGGPLPPEGGQSSDAEPSQGDADPMDDVMRELLAGGGEGASERPGQAIPTPLAKSLLDRINGEKSLGNGNGKH